MLHTKNLTFAIYPCKVDLDIDFPCILQGFIDPKKMPKTNPQIAISTVHAQSGVQWLNNAVGRTMGQQRNRAVNGSLKGGKLKCEKLKCEKLKCEKLKCEKLKCKNWKCEKLKCEKW